MQHVSRIKIAAVLTVFVLFFAPMQVFAAEVRVDSRSQKIKAGEQFEAGIFLDTEQEYINAVEGKILFPNDLLELKEIRDGNSVINFWIERPRMVETGVIDFSGIIPGGYQETKGFLFSVVFQATLSGSGVIEMRDIKVLLNDGKGTPAKVKISNFPFFVQDFQGHAISQAPIVKDTEPPESFVPEIAKDDALFEGRWFVVFATQDKASGVDRYEIKESRQRILSVFGKWVAVESPRALADQELRSYIFVKAVDKNGNKRITELTPQNPLAWYENYENWVMIIIGLLIIAFIARKLWEKQLT